MHPSIPHDDRMLNVPNLRRLCLIEGLSLILLVGVAMPLKYVWAMPLAVRYVGMVHGLLWLVLIVLLIAVAWRLRWSLGRSSAVFFSSIVPFGFLLIDGRMKTWDAPVASSARR
jgi:integral membrane protein